MNKRSLLNKLSENPLKNISTLGFFKNNNLEKVYRAEDSFLMLGTSDYLWAYIVGDDRQELSEIMNKYQFETKYFASVEDWMIPIITKEQEIDWKLTTYRYFLPTGEDIQSASESAVELGSSFAEYIYNNSDYKDYTSPEYIKNRIKEDVAVGIFVDNKLVGWGLTHDDGALGFLHVLPEYRRRGYGVEIVKKLIEEKRKLDKPVFCNIEPENDKSRNLVDKLGFVVDRKISWVKLI